MKKSMFDKLLTKPVWRLCQSSFYSLLLLVSFQTLLFLSDFISLSLRLSEKYWLQVSPFLGLGKD